MCDWKKWIFPGLLVIGALTFLAALLRPNYIEAELKQRVNAALSGQHDWASVSLDARDLVLSGTAPSEAARDEALRIADAAYDVRVVSTDADLIAIASPYPFTATKDNDGLTLSGNVPDEVTRVELIARAQEAMPGIAVKDDMTLARGASEGFVPLANFGLSQLADFTSGKVEISDSEYSVSGIATDNAAYQNALAATSAALPGDGAVTNVDITPPPMDGDYRFGARLDGQNLVLDGFAPDADTRTMLVDRATGLFPDATIDNQILLATGAPAGFADMSGFGLDQLAGLSSGAITLVNQDYAIEGVAKTSAGLIETRDALAGTLPEGMNVASNAILPPLNAGDYVLSAAKSDETLRLSGVAPTLDDIAAIEDVARTEFPNLEIVNELQVAAGAPDGVNWKDASTFGLQQLSGLKSGSMQMVNTDLSVMGEAASSPEFETLQNALANNLPAGIAATDNAVTAPMVDPYSWSAVKSGGEIALGGFAPSRNIANQNVEQAAKLGTVSDRQLIGSGVPSSYDAAVVFGFGALNQLDRGAALLSGNMLKINGETADLATKLRLDEELAASLPDGLDVAVNITATPFEDYKWSASKSTDGIVLDGYAPSDRIKNANVTTAKGATSGAVTDNQILAAGAPSGFSDATVYGLQSLERLESGEARYENGSLTVTGEVASFAERITLENEMSEVALSGTDVVFELTSPPQGNVELPAMPTPPAPMETIIPEVAPEPTPVVELPALPTPPAPLEPMVAEVTPEPAPEVAPEPAPEPVIIIEQAFTLPDPCVELVKRVSGVRTVVFETGKANIDSNSFTVLDEFLFVAQSCSTIRFVVEGHTDSQGADEANQALSEARAQAVRDWLVSRGMQPASIEAKGFGETVPIADNATSEGRALNRRIEIKAIQ